jgi:hypothetical protein
MALKLNFTVHPKMLLLIAIALMHSLNAAILGGTGGDGYRFLREPPSIVWVVTFLPLDG